MRAMLLDAPHAPLRLAHRPVPQPGAGQVLLRVHACGVCVPTCTSSTASCRSPAAAGDRAPDRRHRRRKGEGAARFRQASASACPGWAGPAAPAAIAVPAARTCATGPLHRLPDRRRLRRDDAVADERLCFPIPAGYPMTSGGAAALCRADRLSRAASGGGAGEARRLGSTASAPPPTSSSRWRGTRVAEVLAFTRPGDEAGQRFARRARLRSGRGRRRGRPPEPLDAALMFAPAGELVPAGAAGRRQGRHRGLRRHPHERHPGLSVPPLWGERALRSVANLTRRDGEEFLALAPAGARADRGASYPLEKADEALIGLRSSRVRGAAVLLISQ